MQSQTGLLNRKGSDPNLANLALQGNREVHHWMVVAI